MEKDLDSMLDSVSFKELLISVQKEAKNGNKDVVKYLKAIFQGSSLQNDECEKRRFESFKCALSLLQMPNLSANLSFEIVSLLILKIDLLQTSHLMKLSEMFVEHAKISDNFGAKWLEIFSKVMSCLQHRDSIVYQGNDTSGAELKKSVISSLFAESNIPCIVQLASVLKDMDITVEEMKIISENMLKALPDIDFMELPPFVYQLLLLSVKGQRAQILEGIISFFILKDNKIRDSASNNEDSEGVGGENHDLYRQTEGTVIFMMSASACQDQNVSKEFLQFVKKMQYVPEVVFSPFVFATSLSLIKSNCNKDEVFDSLKKSMLTAFLLKDKKKNSVWLRNLICLNPDILQLVKEAINSSRFGWDHICQGLVSFGFYAIEAFGPRKVAGNAVKMSCEEAFNLASHILRDTFKSHRAVRREIFEQILNRIITKTQKPVSYYIDILSQFSQSDPLFLLDVLPKLIELLDCIHFLPPTNASEILHSLAPLLKISSALKDALMLVLRKALFHKDLDVRKFALCGYITLLKKMNVIGKFSLSQSQTSLSSQASSSSLLSQVKADVHVKAGSINHRAMCLEIIGLLKRALMEQSQIKQLLYEGLYDVVLHNASFKDIVLELLLGQFERYFNSSESSDLVLDLNICFEESKNGLIVKEPLAHLIASMHLILSEGSNFSADDEDDNAQSAQKISEENFLILIKKLADANVNRFQFSKEDELDDEESSNSGSLKVALMLNIYETLMEYSFVLNEEYSSEGCEELLKLYHRHKEILETTTKKKQNKNSKPKTNQNQLASSFWSIRYLSKVMDALFCDKVLKHQTGLKILRDDAGFIVHVINVCHQKLLKLSESGSSEGFSHVMKNSFNYIITIGKVLLKTYCEGISSDFSSVNWEKVSIKFAESLVYIFIYVSSYHSKNMDKFVIEINEEQSLSISEALKNVLNCIKEAIMKLLSDTDDDSNLKECVPLLSVIKILYSSFTEHFKDNIYKWLKQLCTQQFFQNTSISKSFISLCFTLAHQNEHFLTFLQEIAFDIHYRLGNTDPDESVNGNPKYEIITTEVACGMIPSLLLQLEQILDDAEWVLNFLKANSQVKDEIMKTLKSKTIDKCKIEQGICVHLSGVILVLHELVQTSVPPDSLPNNILKIVTKFYRLLTSLTRYYLLFSKNKNISLHQSFEKLVKLSGHKLTSYVYCFITYVQMVWGEERDKKKKTKNHVVTNKAVQENKTLPALVFAIETYEKNLILLSKKCNKNLTSHMKVSTARDFRINPAVVRSLLEQQENDEANSTADTATDGDVPDNNVPSQGITEEDLISNIDASDQELVIEDKDDEPKRKNTSIREKKQEKRKVINDDASIKNDAEKNKKRKRLGIRRSAK